MARIVNAVVFLVACLLSGGCFVGCGRGVDPDAAIASVNATNLQRLANLYLTYQMKNDWRGPANEAEFKQFIRNYNPKKLSRIGIDPAAIDELFINERDEKPFKIRYGVAGSAMGSSEPVVFESAGVGGKRLVGFLNMQQREVESPEYDDLWAGTSPRAESERDAQ